MNSPSRSFTGRTASVARIAPFEGAGVSPIASTDVERSLIASILRNPNQFEVAHTILANNPRPDICKFDPHEAFFDRAYAWIYQALLHVFESHSQIDLAIAVDWMQSTDPNRFDKLGGRQWLRAIYTEGFASNTIEPMAQQILDCAIRRTTQSHLMELAGQANDPNISIVKLNEAIAKVPYDLTYARDGNAIAQSPSDIIAEMDAEQHAYETTGENVTDVIATGFYDLDAHLGGGIEQGQCVVTGACSSMGKTSFMLAIAANMASKGIPVCILSAEQSPRQLIQQMASHLSKVPTKEFFTPYNRSRLDEVKARSLRQAFEDIRNLPLEIKGIQGSWYTDIRLEIQKWASFNKANNRPPGVVFIDYIQRINDVHQQAGGNTHAEITRIVTGLANLGVELQTAIWFLSQLNRNVESRTNKRPTLSDLKESGSIGESARLITFLYRDSYYNPDGLTHHEGLDTTEVIVAKGSRCGTATINLNWHKEFAGFSNRATR